MKKLNSTVLSELVGKRITDDVKNARVNGVTVIVNQNGERLYKESFFDDTCGTVDGKTLFRLASMTKPITAVAIMILRDRRLLSLDDPISKFLPAFSEMNIGKLDESDAPVFVCNAEKQITVRHLLTHSSGLGSDNVGLKCWDIRPESCKHKLADSVDYYAETYLGFEPFTKQMYSPAMGFDVLGRIVEILSGMELEDFFQKEIFKPLGMNNTTFNPTDEQWNSIVPMHDHSNGENIIYAIEKGFVFEGIPHTCYCGAGGLVSSAEDYSAFAEMLLWGKGILSVETLREMATPQLPLEIMDSDNVWGLGMRVVAKENYKDLPVGCFGWSGAYGTHFWVDPENKITAVYMKNSHCSPDIGGQTARNFEKDVTASFEN